MGLDLTVRLTPGKRHLDYSLHPLNSARSRWNRPTSTACIARQRDGQRQAARAAGAGGFSSDRTNSFCEEDSTALFERDAFAYQAARRLATLDAEHEGLVFGRTDLTTSRPATGRPHRRATTSTSPWRPRRRAVLPRHTRGPHGGGATARAALPRRQGDRPEDDLLDWSTPTDLPIVGEGALMASLSRARGRTMRDIVATIQAEQDEAIRAPYQGVTIISGGPGTGKTVVALHRAAYLLYTNRARLEKGGVLVVGPSSVFMNYIERVLPSPARTPSR